MAHDPFDPIAADVELRKKYPSVPLGHAVVQTSYQLLAARFEAADNRLTSVMTLASSLTLGAPILAKSMRQNIQFHSPWFIAAMALFVCSLTIGIVGRVRGQLRLPDPALVYRRWLTKPEWVFMKDTVFYAGEHFDHNAKQVRAKGNTSLLVAALLGAEVILLVVWIAV